MRPSPPRLSPDRAPDMAFLRLGMGSVSTASAVATHRAASDAHSPSGRSALCSHRSQDAACGAPRGSFQTHELPVLTFVTRTSRVTPELAEMRTPHHHMETTTAYSPAVEASFDVSHCRQILLVITGSTACASTGRSARHAPKWSSLCPRRSTQTYACPLGRPRVCSASQRGRRLNHFTSKTLLRDARGEWSATDSPQHITLLKQRNHLRCIIRI